MGSISLSRTGSRTNSMKGDILNNNRNTGDGTLFEYQLELEKPKKKSRCC